MSFQDKILDALAPEKEGVQEEDSRSAQEIFESSISFSAAEIMSEIDSMLENLDHYSSEDVVKRSARLSAKLMHCFSLRMARPRPHAFLLDAIDTAYLGNRESIKNNLLFYKKDLEKYMREEFFLSLFRSSDSSIDYIREVFEEDTAKRLAYISGTKEATAKRWIAGSNPQHETAIKLRHLARMFYVLKEERAINNEEILAWYTEPFSNDGQNTTIEDLFQSWSYYMPDILKEEMARIEDLSEEI